MTGMNSPQKPNQKLISLLMYLSIEKTFSHGNVQEAEIVFFVLATTGLWNNSEPPRKVPGPSRNIWHWCPAFHHWSAGGPSASWLWDLPSFSSSPCPRCCYPLASQQDGLSHWPIFCFLSHNCIACFCSCAPLPISFSFTICLPQPSTPTPLDLFLFFHSRPPCSFQSVHLILLPFTSSHLSVLHLVRQQFLPLLPALLAASIILLLM